MADGISRINNIRPSYPVQPVQPAEKERRSGQRQKPAKKRRPEGSVDEESSPSKDDGQHTIDEFI